jgi:hypothetical protein
MIFKKGPQLFVIAVTGIIVTTYALQAQQIVTLEGMAQIGEIMNISHSTYMRL